MNTKRVTHQTAVKRLRAEAEGALKIADELAAYKNAVGDVKGWDGHVRGAYGKRVVAMIWPEERVS